MNLQCDLRNQILYFLVKKLNVILSSHIILQGSRLIEAYHTRVVIPTLSSSLEPLDEAEDGLEDTFDSVTKMRRGAKT